MGKDEYNYNREQTDEGRFARDFYRSAAWKNCRAAFIRSRQGLCERCAAKGLITVGTDVHHKEKLTRANIQDARVSLSFSNLELLCEDCHHKEHGKQDMRTDAEGHVEL